jgi:hypothetical protein
MKKMRFTIDAQGEVQVDVEGAVGAECDSLTSPFEERLGIVARKDRKDSYFQTEESTQIETRLGETP